jgi:hypothetical protein
MEQGGYLQLFLASTYALESYLKVYLASTVDIMGEQFRPTVRQNASRVNMLESFYYIKPWQVELIPSLKSFILDSGAFTFMSGNGGSVDFKEYTKKYGEFVKKYNIKNYFELDIDGVIGWGKYVDLNNYLQDITGAKAIPVMHKSRGKDWYLDAVKENNYIAIGGIVSGEIKKGEFKLLEWFITEAHKQKCKIHGLGFTNLKWLPLLQWDSVDSSSWLYGNRSGVIYKFNGKTIEKHKSINKGRLKAKETAIHNFIEWVKFSEYMEA